MIAYTLKQAQKIYSKTEVNEVKATTIKFNNKPETSQ